MISPLTFHLTPHENVHSPRKPVADAAGHDKPEQSWRSDFEMVVLCLSAVEAALR